MTILYVIIVCRADPLPRPYTVDSIYYESDAFIVNSTSLALKATK